MKERQLAKLALMALGVIAVLFVVSAMLIRALQPSLVQSGEELSVFLRLLLAAASWLRTSGLVLSVAVLCVWGAVFWALMLVDLLQRDFAHPVNKIVWMLILFLPSVLGVLLFGWLGLFLLGLAGALLYYFMVKRVAVGH